MTSTYIEGKIPVLFFKDSDKFVAYSPVLDISTCGNTKPQAKERFLELISIFLEELTEMGTLDDVLTECGWKKIPTKHTWSPPIYKGIQTESIKIPVRG